LPAHTEQTLMIPSLWMQIWTRYLRKSKQACDWRLDTRNGDQFQHPHYVLILFIACKECTNIKAWSKLSHHCNLSSFIHHSLEFATCSSV